MSEAKGVLEGFIWIIFGAALLEIFLVIAAVAGVFGVVTGIVAVLLARRLLKGQDTEPGNRRDSLYVQRSGAYLREVCVKSGWTIRRPF